jgi:hypothetical protein
LFTDRVTSLHKPPLATAVLRNGPFGVVSVPSAAMIVWAAAFVVGVLAFAAWLFRGGVTEESTRRRFRPEC